MRTFLLLGFSLAALSMGCSTSIADVTTGDQFGDEEMSEDTVVASSELGSCYCRQPYTCGHSKSPSRMHPAAYAAMVRAGVSDASLMQTYGDAPASVGTHCPEPGATYSAATDLTAGPNPCARVRELRKQGFAAWYRSPPTFTTHIHAVYAGAPEMKQSLKNQLNSFVVGRNGLANNNVETKCPITAAERAAVAELRSEGFIRCTPGGYYCGGTKVPGASNKLFRCKSDGYSATEVRTCKHGCDAVPGADDSCRCVPGGDYCGEDVVTGNVNTLYRCGADGVSTTVTQKCANGCSVNTGRDDSCL